MKINKPTPIVSGEEIVLFNRNSSISDTLSELEAGNSVLITAFYSNGLLLLKELHTYLKATLPTSSFQEQRRYRSVYHTLSNRILLEIKDHTISVKKSPVIGWLKKLYPDHGDFLLSLPQIQGLNSSWQWYKKGISIPVLRNKLHPYYGTYFPTRFDHLTLFDHWLKRYTGVKKSAIDVGIGSGVLSFQLVKHGFQKVYGTDTNPNAIVGLTAFMQETKLSRKIELDHAHLFGKWEKPSELVIFNPPWLPTSQDRSHLDQAIYYDEALFPEFFKEAKTRLMPNGKLVILFSNLAQITKQTNQHPIEKELAIGGRFSLVKCYKKTVKTTADKSKRNQHWRSTEVVELWELAHQ